MRCGHSFAHEAQTNSRGGGRAFPLGLQTTESAPREEVLWPVAPPLEPDPPAPRRPRAADPDSPEGGGGRTMMMMNLPPNQGGVKKTDHLGNHTML